MDFGYGDLTEEEKKEFEKNQNMIKEYLTKHALRIGKIVVFLDEQGYVTVKVIPDIPVTPKHIYKFTPNGEIYVKVN